MESFTSEPSPHSRSITEPAFGRLSPFTRNTLFPLKYNENDNLCDVDGMLDEDELPEIQDIFPTRPVYSLVEVIDLTIDDLSDEDGHASASSTDPQAALRVVQRPSSSVFGETRFEPGPYVHTQLSSISSASASRPSTDLRAALREARRPFSSGLGKTMMQEPGPRSDPLPPCTPSPAQPSAMGDVHSVTPTTSSPSRSGKGFPFNRPSWAVERSRVEPMSSPVDTASLPFLGFLRGNNMSDATENGLLTQHVQQDLTSSVGKTPKRKLATLDGHIDDPGDSVSGRSVKRRSLIVPQKPDVNDEVSATTSQDDGRCGHSSSGGQAAREGPEVDVQGHNSAERGQASLTIGDWEVSRILRQEGSRFEAVVSKTVWLPKDQLDGKLLRKFRAEQRRATPSAPMRQSARLQQLKAVGLA